MKGYMYILECANGNYYTGSTKNLKRRLAQHQNGEGANFTKKHLPVRLVYFEEYKRIDEAFYREKQVQGWSRAKKKALINSQTEKLHELAECQNESHYKNARFDYAQRAASLLTSLTPTHSLIERSRNERSQNERNQNRTAKRSFCNDKTQRELK